MKFISYTWWQEASKTFDLQEHVLHYQLIFKRCWKRTSDQSSWNVNYIFIFFFFLHLYVLRNPFLFVELLLCCTFDTLRWLTSQIYCTDRRIKRIDTSLIVAFSSLLVLINCRWRLMKENRLHICFVLLEIFKLDSWIKFLQILQTWWRTCVTYWRTI